MALALVCLMTSLPTPVVLPAVAVLAGASTLGSGTGLADAGASYADGSGGASWSIHTGSGTSLADAGASYADGSGSASWSTRTESGGGASWSIYTGSGTGLADAGVALMLDGSSGKLDGPPQWERTGPG
eukprot:gene11050-18655_t